MLQKAPAYECYTPNMPQEIHDEATASHWREKGGEGCNTEGCGERRRAGQRWESKENGIGEREGERGIGVERGAV